MNELALMISGRRLGRIVLGRGLRSFFCSFGRSLKGFLGFRLLGINKNMRIRGFLSTFMIIEGFCFWGKAGWKGFWDLGFGRVAGGVVRVKNLLYWGEIFI